MTVADTAAARRPRPFDPWSPIWRLLTSVRIAVFYIALLAAFGLVGVLVPQVPEAMRGNDTAVQAWLEVKRDTFGPLTDPMYRFGLFSVFQAQWFLIALGFLVVFVTTCTFNRWAPTFRNVFRPPVRVPDSFYVQAHNRTVFAPVPAGALESALRSMRFGRIETETRDGATHVFADRFPWTQLSTFVSHLALILFLAGGLVTWMTGFNANIFTGEGTTQPVFAVSDPGQLQVRVDDAVGTYGDAGNALDFRTHLTIFKNGEEVKTGYTTVNDPLKYGGYRFHQAAFFPYGAALRIRDIETGNTVFRETFPMDKITAAPVVSITDASGREVLRDTIAPTDFLQFASGTVIDVPDGDKGPGIWVGLTPKNDDEWQLVAYDPASGDPASGLRVDEGDSGQIGGYTLRFEEVVSLPAAVGIDIPDLVGSGEETLAQLVRSADGRETLMLVAEGRPAISLAPNEAVVSGYEYTFEGAREFTGIQVKRDSGAWFIWIATGMLLLGLAITFYVPRRRLWIRVTGEGTQIAALAEKSGGFEKDMRTLARRLGVVTPAELQEGSVVQMLHLLSITIDWNPNIAEFGSLQLTWHGVFTAVGIAAAVYFGAWLGRRQGFTEDDAYSIALVGVPSGIIGARAMYVLENREAFEGQWLDVLKVNEGGITIYGAVIGGILGALIYGWIRRLPVTRGLDVAGPGLLLGMAIGRLGDLVNGEHVAKTTDLPWGVVYTHLDSPTRDAYAASPITGNVPATHPATTYEMIGDLLIIGILAYLFSKLWFRRPGITFFVGVVLYSAMRFGVSYLRIDSGVGCPNSVNCPDYLIKDWMTFPQVVSMITFTVGMLGLAWTVLRGEQPEPVGSVWAEGTPDNPLDRKPASSRSTS